MPGPFAAIVIAIATMACSRAPPGKPAAASGAPADGTPRLHDNVARADYAGSGVCARCHPSVVAKWERSPMHRMTRDARTADVRAPFDGTRWRFKSDVVTLERRGGDRLVRVEPGDGPASTYRVTRVLGGRTREDFVGVDVDHGGDEVVLPVSYLLESGAFRYKGYSVMVHERASLRAGPVWRQTCIFCHNTVPELDRLLALFAAPRAPAFQGESVERWLRPERRESARVLEPGGFESAIDAEVLRLGGAPLDGGGGVRAQSRRAIAVVRARFDAPDLVETGIGCEACHGGAREHVEDPDVSPSFVPTAPWLDVAVPGGGRAAAVNHACARCHQVLFSRYPFTWEGGRRDGLAGGSHISSGEARDFLLGGCSGAMACTSCHDPHAGDDPEALRAFDTPARNATCTACHRDLRDRERLRAHAHHDPDGAAGACVACHMPRKNMGLDGRLTRYHRIGSPTDPDRVLGDRPLECALCHADRSVRDLVDRMEAWWPVRYPRQRLEELYGSLDANVMRATLERGKAHERVVAIATLGRARARDAAPRIARELLDEYPLVREWARRALVSILGRCDVDLSADDAQIARQAAACAGTSLPPAAAAAPGDEDPED